MALIPKIALKVLNTGSKVDVWEKTGIYDLANPGGWGTPNIDVSNIVSANVKIYDYAGVSLLQTIAMKDSVVDVYGVLPTTTPGPFKATTETWNQVDGIFKIEYSLIDSFTQDYSNEEQYELITVNLCNCMDKLIAKLVDICSKEKLEKYKEVVDQLEIFKYGIETAFANCDFTKATALLENASTLCTTFSDCGCGCDDC